MAPPQIPPKLKGSNGKRLTWPKVAASYRVRISHTGTNTPHFVPFPGGTAPFSLAQIGLCKFGWVWSSMPRATKSLQYTRILLGQLFMDCSYSFDRAPNLLLQLQHQDVTRWNPYKTHGSSLPITVLNSGIAVAASGPFELIWNKFVANPTLRRSVILDSRWPLQAPSENFPL